MSKLHFVGLKLFILGVIGCFLFQASLGQSISKIGSNNSVGKYVDVKGAKLYYEIYGKGEPLLMIHGGLGSMSDFEKNIPELAMHFKIIAIDSRGYGRSSNYMDSISYELLTDDMKQILDFLKLDSVNVCGFSDGGIVALFLAAKYPRKVKKVFASGANYLVTGSVPNASDNIAFMQKLKTDPFWTSIRATYNDLSPTPEKFDRHVQLVRKMWYRNPCIPRKIFIKIGVPVFLLFGDRDIVPLEHGLEMYKLLSKKTTQLCILPKTTHFTFSDKPQVVDELIIHFF